jgi:NAD(P)H-flavin reductase
MGAMLDEVVQFFKEEGWPYSQMEEQLALNVIFQGKSGTCNCVAQVEGPGA